MSAIKVKALCKTFSYYKKEVGLRNSIRQLFKREQLMKQAVKGVTFEMDEGEIVGFLGANGAGKTTTLKMLSGILHPSSGNVQVYGYTPWERKKEFKKIFSIIIGQKTQLWWDLPASESFFLNKYIYEIDDSDYNNTLFELIELLDVKEQVNVQVRRLSLGERMKMEIIAALLHRPKVIFLDEPTIGLDIIAQKKIRDFLKYYNKQYKSSIILTSHYMKDIEDLCRRTVIINKGMIVYDGNLANLREKSKKLIKLQLSIVLPEEIYKRFGEVKIYMGDYVEIEMDRRVIDDFMKNDIGHLPMTDYTIEDIPIEEAIAILYRKEESHAFEHSEIC